MYNDKYAFLKLILLKLKVYITYLSIIKLVARIRIYYVICIERKILDSNCLVIV